jgi:hypothetical protein
LKAGTAFGYFALAASLAAAPARAKVTTASLIPDYARLQYAGTQGFLSLGVGKSFLEGRIEPELVYGYVPEAVGGVSIHLWSQMTTFSAFPTRLGKSPWILYPALGGYSLIIGVGKHYELYREKYVGYYWPTAIHFRLFAGTKLFRKAAFAPWATGFAGTVQVGAIDSDLASSFSNSSIGLLETVNVAASFSLYFADPKPHAKPKPEFRAH